MLSTLYCIKYVVLKLMKTSNLLLLGIGGWIVLRLTGMSRVSNSLVFIPASIGVKREGKNIKINFGLDIENSAPASVTVNRTYGQVVDNANNTLGRFTTDRYDIPAQGTTRLNIPITLQLFGSSLALINSIINKNLQLTIQYTNEIGLLSVNEEYKFNLKDALSFPALKKLRNEKAENPLTK